MELRIMPSDPGFRDVEFIANWIAKLKNAHMFHDLKAMPEVERLVYLKDLEDLFEQLTHGIGEYAAMVYSGSLAIEAVPRKLESVILFGILTRLRPACRGISSWNRNDYAHAGAWFIPQSSEFIAGPANIRAVVDFTGEGAGSAMGIGDKRKPAMRRAFEVVIGASGERPHFLFDDCLKPRYQFVIGGNNIIRSSSYRGLYANQVSVPLRESHAILILHILPNCLHNMNFGGNKFVD